MQYGSAERYELATKRRTSYLSAEKRFSLLGCLQKRAEEKQTHYDAVSFVTFSLEESVFLSMLLETESVHVKIGRFQGFYVSLAAQAQVYSSTEVCVPTQ